MLVLIVAIVIFLRSLFKIKSQKSIFLINTLRLVRFSLLIYTTFLLFWGLNYSRPNLAVLQADATQAVWRFAIKDSTKVVPVMPVDTLLKFGFQLVTDLNILRSETQLAQYSWKDWNEQAQQLYQQHQAFSVVSTIKKASLGNWLNGLGIQGYFNPLTGEGQCVSDLPITIVPFVILHEMAHQAGIASEGDANFLALLLTQESQNKQVQYAGLLNVFLYLRNELKQKDTLYPSMLVLDLSNEVQRDLSEIDNYRKKHRSHFRFISLGFYDSFLRFFGQKQGIRSYGGVTQKYYYWQRNKHTIDAVFEKL